MTSASSLRSSSPAAAKGSSSTASAAASMSSDRMKSPETLNNGANVPPAEGSAGKEQNAEKLQTLKQRKFDLEKLLNEKNALLEQIQRQEQQIIAGEFEMLEGHVKSPAGGHHTNSLTLRKKINATTSFKMPNSTKGMYAKERSGSVGDMEKKIRQEMMSAAQAPKTIEMTLSKSLRSMPYAEYDPALFATNKLHARRSPVENAVPPPASFATTTASNAISIAAEYNSMKNPKLMAHSPQGHQPSQRGSPIPLSPASVGVPMVGKYPTRSAQLPLLNQNANYTLSDRRNSIKSMQQLKSYPSPKQQHRQDDRLSMIVGTSAGLAYTPAMPPKNTRSDYDLTSYTMPAGARFTYDNESVASLGSFPIMMDAYSNDSLESIHSPPAAGRGGGGVMYAVGKPLPPPPPPQSSLHYAHSHAQQSSSSIDYDELMYVYPPVGRKPDQHHAHTMRPMTAMDHSSPQGVGLGGYWKTIGNERIWCTVDTCYDGGSGGQQQQLNTKIKKSNAIARTTPTKSISLGNFDMIVVDSSEQTDKISISSMNSDGNKKPREKQWLETSLDAPTSSSKPTAVGDTSSNRLKSTTTGGCSQQQQRQQSPVTAMTTYDRLNTDTLQQQQQQLRQTSTKLLRTGGYLSEHSRPTGSHIRRATTATPMTIAAAAAVSATPRTTTPPHPSASKSPTPSSHVPLDMYVSPVSPAITTTTTVTAMTATSSKSNPIRSATPQQQQQQSSISLAANLNPRSPSAVTNLAMHHEHIRIESPKNMTVVQQAVFMPYKEVSKPFEMSDFYKYSTKFRQKDKQQQPMPDRNSSHQQPKAQALHVEQ